MARQLNIRSDEAYEIATQMARQTGRTRGEIVLAALLRYREARTGRTLTPEQRAFVDELMALAERSAAVAPAGMTSDHANLYDERGLPK
jgi:antitoxin VapB